MFVKFTLVKEKKNVQSKPKVKIMIKYGIVKLIFTYFWIYNSLNAIIHRFERMFVVSDAKLFWIMRQDVMKTYYV